MINTNPIILPARKLREMALATEMNALSVAPEVIEYCMGQAKEAAKRFGRQRVVIEYAEIRDAVPTMKYVEMEPVLTLVKQAFEEQGYTVDLMRQSSLTISCAEKQPEGFGHA